MKLVRRDKKVELMRNKKKMKAMENYRHVYLRVKCGSVFAAISLTTNKAVAIECETCGRRYLIHQIHGIVIIVLDA